MRALYFSSNDEDVVSTPDHVELLQSQPPVTDAFAGSQLEFIAVPRTDEMHVVRERLALVVAVGEIVAVLVEHADFGASGNDDPPVPVLHLGRLGNKAFGHGSLPHNHPRMELPAVESRFCGPAARRIRGRA